LLLSGSGVFCLKSPSPFFWRDKSGFEPVLSHRSRAPQFSQLLERVPLLIRFWLCFSRLTRLNFSPPPPWSIGFFHAPSISVVIEVFSFFSALFPLCTMMPSLLDTPPLSKRGCVIQSIALREMLFFFFFATALLLRRQGRVLPSSFPHAFSLNGGHGTGFSRTSRISFSSFVPAVQFPKPTFILQIFPPRPCGRI